MSRKKPDPEPDLFSSVPPRETFAAFPTLDAFPEQAIAFLTGKGAAVPEPVVARALAPQAKPVSKPHAKPEKKPVIKPVSQSARQPASQPVSQSVSKPGTQPL